MGTAYVLTDGPSKGRAERSRGCNHTRKMYMKRAISTRPAAPTNDSLSWLCEQSWIHRDVFQIVAIETNIFLSEVFSVKP